MILKWFAPKEFYKLPASVEKNLEAFLIFVSYFQRKIGTFLWILEKLSKSLTYRKVRDHCHFTGKYRGATHIICNLIFTVPNEITLIFQNGSN